MELADQLVGKLASLILEGTGNWATKVLSESGSAMSDRRSPRCFPEELDVGDVMEALPSLGVT